MYSLIHHPDSNIRQAFLSGYEKIQSPCPECQKQHLTVQETLIAWESAPHIPVHTHQDESGVHVWILGHIEGLDKELSPAVFLLERYGKKVMKVVLATPASLYLCFTTMIS
ncbi:hypothetical protein [Sedimenticola thiotaurini]|uniref:Uncharacterized protein n=1 Tax=Sedimenticola thiotaurini TaxID=1543721 RepID=A0A0F7JWF6_9GAMM|nr:hypothetical protein [Sedimenticola thiotaurini]AKH19704.1 hypothetical protein AAY24_04275 [Sedimenticola thiotaurini]